MRQNVWLHSPVLTNPPESWKKQEVRIYEFIKGIISRNPQKLFEPTETKTEWRETGNELTDFLKQHSWEGNRRDRNQRIKQEADQILQPPQLRCSQHSQPDKPGPGQTWTRTSEALGLRTCCLSSKLHAVFLSMNSQRSISNSSKQWENRQVKHKGDR